MQVPPCVTGEGNSEVGAALLSWMDGWKKVYYGPLGRASFLTRPMSNGISAGNSNEHR